MTSTARACRPFACRVGGGFTLLEIIITLTIAAFVMAGAIGLMRFSGDDRDLSVASTEIEALAKRARAAAIMHQTPYALELAQSGVRMLPLAQLALGDEDPAQEQPEAGGTVRGSYALESGMTMAVQRWNARGWDEIEKNRTHIWRFDPDGLCEPIGLRLQTGNTATEYAFHPLTATIRKSAD